MTATTKPATATVRRLIHQTVDAPLPRIVHADALVVFIATQQGPDNDFAVWLDLQFRDSPLFYGTFYPHGGPYDVRWHCESEDGEDVPVSDGVYCYLDPPGDDYHRPLTLGDITPDLREWIEREFQIADGE